MTQYVSTQIPFGLIKRADSTGAPLGYLAYSKPVGADLAGLTSRLAAAGCSPKLISAHLEYLYGTKGWKSGWLYSDGVVSNVDVLARRKAAFKAKFRLWMQKFMGKTGNHPGNLAFFESLGYTATGDRAQYADVNFCAGEIHAQVRGVAMSYVLSPPMSGIPDICDGLRNYGTQGSMSEGSKYTGDYWFRWYDGDFWQIAAVNPDYATITESTTEAGRYYLDKQPSVTSDGFGLPVAELTAFGELGLAGFIESDASYEAYVARSKQTKVVGMKLRPVWLLPASAHVTHVWWNVGPLPPSTLPASLLASERGAVVSAESLAEVVEKAAMEANDAIALAEASRLRSSGAYWKLHFVGPRQMRRKIGELGIAREGDITQIENEMLIAVGQSERYPNGITLRQVEQALTARSLKEGLTFSHMVSQGVDDFEAVAAGGLTVSVDFIGGYVYGYPGELDGDDVLAALSDGGHIVFNPSPAAVAALSVAAIKDVRDRWALDTFNKTFNEVVLESARLAMNVTSLWDPSHYFDKARPWALKDVNRAELAFLQEVSGGFEARAMLIAVSESEGIKTFR